MNILKNINRLISHGMHNMLKCSESKEIVNDPKYKNFKLMFDQILWYYRSDKDKDKDKDKEEKEVICEINYNISQCYLVSKDLNEESYASVVVDKYQKLMRENEKKFYELLEKKNKFTVDINKFKDIIKKETNVNDFNNLYTSMLTKTRNEEKNILDDNIVNNLFNMFKEENFNKFYSLLQEDKEKEIKDLNEKIEKKNYKIWKLIFFQIIHYLRSTKEGVDDNEKKIINDINQNTKNLKMVKKDIDKILKISNIDKILETSIDEKIKKNNLNIQKYTIMNQITQDSKKLYDMFIEKNFFSINDKNKFKNIMKNKYTDADTDPDPMVTLLYESMQGNSTILDEIFKYV